MTRISRGLLASLMLVACSSAPLAPSQTIAPSPNLRLTASLNQPNLHPGNTVQLSVQLKNAGLDQVPIPGVDRCNPALQVFISDANDRIVWAQPLPACAEPQGPLPVSLAPGDQVTGSQCLTLANAAGDASNQCARLELPAGTVFVTGSFHGMSLPRLRLSIGRS